MVNRLGESISVEQISWSKALHVFLQFRLNYKKKCHVGFLLTHKDMITIHTRLDYCCEKPNHQLNHKAWERDLYFLCLI